MSKNTLNLDTSGLDELINKLKKLEGDVKGAVTDAMEQAAQTIEEDTREAVQPPNLPAMGKYQGKEKDTIGPWLQTRIFLFGVFELMAWQKKQPPLPAKK